MMRRLQCHHQMVRYYLFNSILNAIYLLIPGVPPPANGTEVYMLLYNLIEVLAALVELKRAP